jgi:hypothetical protein
MNGRATGTGASRGDGTPGAEGSAAERRADECTKSGSLKVARIAE